METDVQVVGRGPITNTSGELHGAGPAPGIDLRGEGGYVLAPPSRHVSGGRYHFPPTAFPPDHLPVRPSRCRPAPLEHRPSPTAHHLSSSRAERYVETALQRESERVSHAPEGHRNRTLLASARALGTLVGADVLAEERARATLAAAAERAGLGRRETEATISSGLEYGIKEPRSLDVHPLAVPQPDPTAARHEAGMSIGLS
jgi:hypothetical protein